MRRSEFRKLTERVTRNLFERCTFKEGMNSVNKSTADLRNAAAQETGLSVQSVNVRVLTYASYLQLLTTVVGGL